MKIRELTGYKSNPLFLKAQEIFSQDMRDVKLDIQLEQWEEIMKQYGFAHLGTGSFGSVYEKPGYPWVFKIFRNDFPYLNFIKYAKRNQNNPYMPKVKGGIIQINKDTFAIRTQKLEPIDTATFQKLDTVISTFQDIIADERQDDLEDWEQNMMKKHYGLYEFVYAWWNGIFGSTASLDLHAANIRMRGTQPVLSDPVT
jgi:hypothetical protein